MKKRPGTRRFWLLAYIALASCALPCLAQEPPQPTAPNGQAAAPGPPLTVHGVVTNAATGSPLERALVTVFGDPNRGAMTDNEGRFELHGIPQGSASFMVIKPGFDRALYSDEGDGPLTIFISDSTPEIHLSLIPKNSISGHVTLSSGLPAENFSVMLLKQAVMYGHASWRSSNGVRTAPDGSFRFGALGAGSYLVRLQPELENAGVARTPCSAQAPETTPGYAEVFSNGSADFAGAEPITVKDGQSAEVNLALTQVQFHRVQIAIAGPAGGAGQGVNTTLLDSAGQEAGYPVRIGDHVVCAYLPDGSYTLVARTSQTVSYAAPNGGVVRGSTWPQQANGSPQIGVLEFSVEGKPITNLRVALAPPTATPVHVRYAPGPPKPSPNQNGEGTNEAINLMAWRVNGTQPYLSPATRVSETEYELGATAPGSYWISATSEKRGACVGAVTAGGENLANHPWVVRNNGTGTPIDVDLRTDCGKLTVTLPPGAAGQNLSGDSAVYVYVVPELDTVNEIDRMEIDQSQINPLTINGSVTIAELAPGRYRVYAMRTRQPVEYHNPAAMDQLGAGQEIELEPNGEATLTLEAVSQ